jgi:uncharacterized protein YbjT (DUF2867 family)
MTKGTIAITGGTGFVGSTMIRLALEAGWQIKALTRKAQAEREGITWIGGTLDQPSALAELMDGADAVLHIAGVTNAMSKAAFIAGNVDGTAATIAAATLSGVRRFIHVSSLSAREPHLSDYGWSKAEAEKLVAASGLDWTMVRPPAIYGPGDVDHLDLFKAAKIGIIPLPPRGRISEIEVSDLARLLLALVADKASIYATYEADDGREGGWTHEEFALAIGTAMGRTVWPLHLPATIVKLGARGDRLLRGAKAKLTPDRAAYFCHADWVIDPANRPPAKLWQPQVATTEGLRETAEAYRKAGWLA